jgi:hypothetical protein
MDETRKKFKTMLIEWCLSVLMALLFSGGILLGGAEFVGFPWGPLIGAACFGILGLIAYQSKNM